jgi:ketosteroid isomerase-like protein
MDAQRQTIERLYQAFARLDTETMADCYAPDATFEDEVFSLKGRREVMGMWTMLCDAVRAKGQADWRLEWSGVQAEGTGGRAHWEAWYRFSATGRLVHNRIDATFRFAPDGRIAVHRDRFDFWRWSRQALGAPGLLLGWTPLVRGKARARAAANLRRHLESTPA